MTPAAPDDVLTVSDLTVVFGGRRAGRPSVDGIDLTVPAGGCVGVVGESGSGKSTLCRSVVATEPRFGERRTGRVVVAGQDVLAMPGRARRQFLGRTVGFVSQESDTALNPLLTCGAQITEHLRLPRREGLALAAELLTGLGMTDVQRVLRSYPLQLSGGMRQRVMLAIALAGGPQLLVADEPTTGLDVTVQAKVLRLLRAQQRERGIALLVVSHDLRVISYLADEIVVMRDGVVVERGPTAKLLAAPSSPYTASLIAASALDEKPPASDDDPTLVEVRDRRPATADPVVEVSGLSVRYPVRGRADVTAVSDVSFRVAEAECVAVVGESGSGKTSLALATLGLVPRSDGSVRFAGGDIAALDTAALRRYRRQVHLMAQGSRGAFNPRWTVEQVVCEPLRVARGPERPDVDRLLTEVTLDPALRTRRIRTLSGGQLQRVALARALSLEPRVLVLDEPFASSDAVVQLQLIDLLNRIRATRGTAIFLISHDLAVVQSIADRVLVMYRGRIVEEGPATVLSEPAHPYTAELVAAASLSRTDDEGTGDSDAADDPVDPPLPGAAGCAYRPRCPQAVIEACATTTPALSRTNGRAVACHRPTAVR